MKFYFVARCLKVVCIIFFVTITGFCSAELVPNNLQDEAANTVNVAAYKNPDRRSYKVFIRGMEAAEKLKDLAPTAIIHFQLTTKEKSEPSTQKIGLRFVAENVDIPIALTDDGLFVLDKILEKDANNAELIVNAKPSTTNFWPSVRTPELPINERRLGDLRLECEMEWAMFKEDGPFIIKATFTLGGGLCHSSKISVSSSEVRKLKAAWLVEADRKLPLSLSASGKNYYPPLYDQSWGHNTRIVFEYEDETIKDSR